MNKLMKFPKVILTIVIMLCVALPTLAHDFEVGGIYYNYLDETAKTVEVTYKGSDYNSYNYEYTGSVTIPSSITYNSTTYSVTSIDSYAFYNCYRLTSITIPNSVTSIGSYAFDGCTGLTSITIPNSVTTIGSFAFYGTTWYNNLADGVIYINNVLYEYKGSMPNGTSISVKDGTVSISPYAFENCTGLTSITIPNSVTSIGNFAFSSCNGLTELIIENGKETLSLGYNYYNYNPYSTGEGLFYDCPLEKLYLGRNLSYNSNQEYGYSPFYSKTKLKEVTIGNSVTSIGDYAFWDCDGLTSITIPNSVTSIGDYAFYDCDGLTSITIPNSVTSIGDHAFRYCTALTSITIPNSVTSIGDHAFGYCRSLTSIIVEEGNPKYDSLDNCNAIIETSTNTLILGCKNSTIPNSVTSIGDHAFRYCTALTSITIPNSVTSIGNYAFYCCTGLTSVTIPNSVTWIGDSAFYNCTGLTSVTIPNSVTSIGSEAFYGCSNLETVINLSNLIFSKGSDGYGYIAYYACRVINDPNVSMVEDFVFSKVDNVNILGAYLGNATELILPTDFNGENYIIGNYAFYNCCGLTSVTIGNSVTSIGESAFYNCTSLTKLILEDGAESISGLSFPSSPIETLYLGRNTSDTFVKGKTTLKEVTIGNSVTSIGVDAFSGCTGLTSVIIGDSVSSIGASSFYGCSNLIESNNVISPTSVKVNLNTQCSSNLVPCIAINNKYYTNNTLVESLDPEYSYNYDLGLKFKDNFILIGSSSFLTGELELTTQAAKATSSSSVRLIATTDCDATAGTGFEWLRYDAPAELPPNKVSCPIVDGMLIGSLRGVRDDAYYKYRPFYTSASGKTYYGEWIAFFTGDANVYFEPEVQTYSDYAITDNSVVVKGYALEGTDEITAQGFEYWKTGSTILPSSTENRMTVMASGIKMSATLANLEYNSTYKYRAFVTTAKGTIYGNEVEFETGEDPVGVESILIDKSATEVFEIARYDIHGRRLNEPTRGINIVIYSDGTTRKEIVKE